MVVMTDHKMGFPIPLILLIIYCWNYSCLSISKCKKYEKQIFNQEKEP